MITLTTIIREEDGRVTVAHRASGDVVETAAEREAATIITAAVVDMLDTDGATWGVRDMPSVN